MDQLQQSVSSPPKSLYQLFIEENDQLLNSISQNEIQFPSNYNDLSDLNLKQEENSDSEYYESLKDSLDSINAKLGVTKKTKDNKKVNEDGSSIDKSRDDSISQINSQSDILPSKKEICPSPLDKRSRNGEEICSTSSIKDQNFLSSSNDLKSDKKDTVLNENSENKSSQYSNYQASSYSKTKSKSKTKLGNLQNDNDLINTPTKAQIHEKSKNFSPSPNHSANSSMNQQNDDSSVLSFQNRVSNSKKNNSINNDIKDNSVISNHSQTPSIKKESSVIHKQNSISSVEKENSVISNYNQTPNNKKENLIIHNQNSASIIKKENSVFSNHSQTPNSKKENSVIRNQNSVSSIKKENSAINDPNQTSKENSVISNHSNHSQSSGVKKSTLSKSMITTSYIDFIDTKQKRILEKWKNEDLEAQRNLEEEMIEKLLTPKHTWKTFKFTSPRSNISSRNSVYSETKTEVSSNLNDEELDRSFSEKNQVFEMPPNPSANFMQMLEIPAIERLITPKKNFTLQQQKQKSKQNSTRPKKTKPLIDDDFVSRQAHYENEKRLKKSMKVTSNQPNRTRRKVDDDVFNKLYEKSIVDDWESSDYEVNEQAASNSSENKNKIKWSNKSHLVLPKKEPKQQPPLNTSDYRNQRFSPMSQKFAQNESRSFQERTSIDLEDILEQNRLEQEQKKKRDLYNDHIENLD